MDWPDRGPDMTPDEHVWDHNGVWIPNMDGFLKTECYLAFQSVEKQRLKVI